MGVDLLRKLCMNELIKQLALKSGFAYEPVKDQLWVSGPNEIMISPGLEKFAELIIRECAKIADDGYASSNFGNGITGCQLLKHLGVE